jgi:cell division protein FtsZ
MIELTRTSSAPVPVVKVVALGSAGANMVDRLVLDGFDAHETVAINTDIQALNASVAGHKVHIGQNTTRGLGAGGDPELGYTAAEESADDIAAAVSGANMVFICAGLGGGTGSGAAPMVAHLARKAGATVIALVTMPFQFEGKRRTSQANEALGHLEPQANLVLCFENDAMGSVAGPTAAVQQAFVATDMMLSQAVRGLAAIVQRRGLVNIGLDDMVAAVGRSRAGGGVRCLFGHGESDSANRAHEAIERALRSPLMDKGRMLNEAHHVLVHISGGSELTLNEVTIAMEEFNRHISDGTRVSFGVGTDPKLGRRICVSVLSSTGPVVDVSRTVRTAAALPVTPLPERRITPAAAPVAAPAPDFFEEPEAEDLDEVAEVDSEPATRTIRPAAKVEPAPASGVIPPAAKKYAPPAAVAASAARAASATPKKEERAEQMTLEPANRGRFEKAEPTIVDGEDLDVPTFLRKTARRG